MLLLLLLLKEHSRCQFRYKKAVASLSLSVSACSLALAEIAANFRSADLCAFLRKQKTSNNATTLNAVASSPRHTHLLHTAPCNRQASPHSGGLLEQFAEASPYPFGQSFAQDLFSSGLIPADTDYRIFRDEASLPGLDLVSECGFATLICCVV